MIVALVHQSIVATLHDGFARVLMTYSLLVGLWGLVLFLRGSNPSGGYMGALVIDEGVAILQSVVGLLLVGQGHRPDDPLHYLYGVVSIMTLPTAYFMSNSGAERRDSLIFGLAALFLLGVGIRATMTGGGH